MNVAFLVLWIIAGVFLFVAGYRTRNFDMAGVILLWLAVGILAYGGVNVH